MTSFNMRTGWLFIVCYVISVLLLCLPYSIPSYSALRYAILCYALFHQTLLLNFNNFQTYCTHSIYLAKWSILSHNRYRKLKNVIANQLLCTKKYENSRCELVAQAREQIAALRLTVAADLLNNAEILDFERRRSVQHLKLLEMRTLNEEKNVRLVLI